MFWKVWAPVAPASQVIDKPDLSETEIMVGPIEVYVEHGGAVDRPP